MRSALLKSFQRSHWLFRHAAWVLACIVLAAAIHPGEAQAQGLEGYWRGGGFISPAKGHRERVRCRVWFSRSSSQSFGVKARCAAQGANIDQTGNVRKTGSNSYAGDFFNQDFNLRGRIRITVRGNQQSVILSSDAGSGKLTLFRR